jgi:PKD repeat protein
MQRLTVTTTFLLIASLLFWAGCDTTSDLQSLDPPGPEASLEQAVPERVGTTKESGDLGTMSFSTMATGSATFMIMESLSAADLADALVGEGVAVSNAVYTGADSSGGTFEFTGDHDVIGIADGIILSSGWLSDVEGPNSGPATTRQLGTPGDADLTALSGFATYDASVLEFDFEVAEGADRVYFEYVFGSEEYNEYVGTSFNDVFAFFVNGVNCATVDGSPVSINTINHGNSLNATPPTNPDYYVNNDPYYADASGTTVPLADLVHSEMDGFTVVLVCEAAVQSGSINTMKLAIADASDWRLDSWVFIKAGSLSINPPGDDPVADPPVADPAGPYFGDEGSAVSFDGSGSLDPAGEGLTYEWDFGDGNTGIGVSPDHTYADNGLYTVRLTVVAADEQSDVETTTATIANVAPSVDAGSDASIYVGATFQLSATFSDPGVNDMAWSYVIDWGNGSQSPGSTSDQSSPIEETSGIYGTAGSYTVEITVTDKDGGQGSDQLTLRVLEVQPPGESAEACTPGFWSNNGLRLALWPAGYAPADPVSGLFAQAGGYLGDATLLAALEGYMDSDAGRNTIAGASEILVRAAVAAVLNEASFGAAYPASDVQAIRDDVNAALTSGDRATILALAELLDWWNNSYELDGAMGLVLDAEGDPVVVGSCPLPRP